ncbi:MAG: right-handed parallel beta-helix repeat-containing protein [Polyangiaceae bacterium]|nr:right-handed parallel beta-helix repeat-containing protein [Polyangiaceae bacterium]
MKLLLKLMKRVGVLTFLVGAGAGCSEVEAARFDCAEGDRVGGAEGVCVGVPATAVCGVDTCTEGILCADIIEVRDDGELNTAIAGATSGACIALAPGTYGPASLPAGVSLVGKSAADVAVLGVTLNGGDGAVVRGLTIQSGGLKINGATGAQINSVLIDGSGVEGVHVAPASEAKIVASTIRGSNRYGVKIGDGADVTIEASIIETSQGPGIWAGCSGACTDCTAPPKLSVTGSIVRENHVGGIALFTTWADLKNVDVLRTKSGDTWHAEAGGGGLSVMSCSNLVARGLRIHDSASYGVLIEASSTNMSSESAPDGDIDIRRNLMGVWVQNVEAPQSVVLTRALLDGNKAVGVGTSGATKGFVFRRSVVQNTVMHAVVAESDGNPIEDTMVGDGFVWRDESSVTIESVNFINNARVSILIDGPAEGSIKNVHLSGGDEKKGPFIQKVSNKDAKPAVDGETPPLSTSKKETFAVPNAPPRIDTNL